MNQEITKEIAEKLTEDQLTALFAERLIMDKGLQTSDELRAKLIEKINEFVNARLVLCLSDEKAEEVSRCVAEGKSADEIAKVFVDAGVDIEAVTKEAMGDFRAKFLGEEA